MTHSEAALMPVLVGAVLLLFITVSARLKMASQPLRLRLAEKGEAFLALPGASKAMKDYVRFLLDSAFGMRLHLLFSLVAIPFIAVLLIVRQRYIRQSVEKFMVKDPEVMAAFVELCRLHDRITLANHFILLPLVELQLVLFMPMAILLRGLIKGVLPDVGGRESVVTFIEDKLANGPRLAHMAIHAR